jgi:hypothetical protein
MTRSFPDFLTKFQGGTIPFVKQQEVKKIVEEGRQLGFAFGESQWCKDPNAQWDQGNTIYSNAEGWFSDFDQSRLLLPTHYWNLAAIIVSTLSSSFWIIGCPHYGKGVEKGGTLDMKGMPFVLLWDLCVMHLFGREKSDQLFCCWCMRRSCNTISGEFLLHEPSGKYSCLGAVKFTQL